MKHNTKKYLYFIPAGLWMLFIFYMSHQSGTTSSSTSTSIVNIFADLLGLSTNSISFLEVVVRKGAHFMEYTLLSVFLIYGFINTIHKNPYLPAIMVAVLYACSDEIHQLFIPGRAGLIQDVLIDGSGACFGAIIMYLLYYKKKSKDSLREISNTEQVERLLSCMNDKEEYSTKELLELLNLKDRPSFKDNYLLPALKLGYIEMITDKPNSSKQKYRRINTK